MHTYIHTHIHNIHTQTQTHTKSITLVMLNSTNLMQKTVILTKPEILMECTYECTFTIKIYG